MFTDFFTGVGGPCARLGESDEARGTPRGGESYWCQPNGRVGGAQFFLRQPIGLSASLPNAPYAAAPANGALLHYWRQGHWYSSFARIASAPTDPGTNITTLAWEFGGFHGAEGADDGEDWYVDHIREELDAPREFFFEAATQNLWYFHNASVGTPPPASWSWEVPMLACLVNVSGSPAAPVRNVTISGISFVAAAASYMAPHGVPSGGDWGVARVGALTAEWSVNLHVAGCTFSRLDGNAVVLNGFNRHASLDANEFAWLGESGIVSWGRVNGSDARDGLQPWGTQVTRNLCHEIGIYEKQTSCYFAALSGGANVSGNIFFNMPRAAVNFNDDMGGGSVVSRNLLWNTCRESQVCHGSMCMHGGRRLTEQFASCFRVLRTTVRLTPGADPPTLSIIRMGATRAASSPFQTRSPSTFLWPAGVPIVVL